MKKSYYIAKVKEWDEKTIVKINGKEKTLLTWVFKFISFFGRETIWFLILAFYLFICYDAFLFVYIGTVFLMGLILIVPIKHYVGRKRPFIIMQDINLLEREQVSGSFPSWHCYNVMAQGLLISILMDSVFILLLVLLFVFLVAYSRLYLGVHYPSDVMVGTLIGIVGFLISYYFFAPFLYAIAIWMEGHSTVEVYPHVLHPYLFTSGWYVVLCIGVFGTIFLSSIFKILENFTRKKEDKAK